MPGPLRRCALPACDTILSRYNPSVLCALHEAYPRHQGVAEEITVDLTEGRSKLRQAERRAQLRMLLARQLDADLVS